MLQCNAIHDNSWQYNTIQYGTVQHKTIQCNTIHYNTIHRGLLSVEEIASGYMEQFRQVSDQIAVQILRFDIWLLSCVLHTDKLFAQGRLISRKPRKFSSPEDCCPSLAPRPRLSGTKSFSEGRRCPPPLPDVIRSIITLSAPCLLIPRNVIW